MQPDELKTIDYGTQAEAVEDIGAKQAIKKQRDDDFIKWIEEAKPSLNDMKKNDINIALRDREKPLWTSGFGDWWKQQTIFKGVSGRKPG